MFAQQSTIRAVGGKVNERAGCARDVPLGTPPPLLDTYTHGLLLTPDEWELWVASYAADGVYAFTVPELEPLPGSKWTRAPTGSSCTLTVSRCT